ncbi:MAG: tetratricopeptide repeat protein [Planctomycetes bacterium]|nr:tetratricopeptide repeat protein [Planctomycetota bacterium]
MFRRLSVLPLLLVIFIALFFSCDIAFGGRSGISSPVGSPTVPISAYDGGFSNRSVQSYNYGQNQAGTGNGSFGRNFRGSIPYRPSYGRLRPLGTSNSNSFNRPSSAYPTGIYSPGRLGQYFPYGSADSKETGPSPDLSNAPLSRGIGDSMLPSLDKKLRDMEYRREKYRGIQKAEIDVFKGPPSSGFRDHARTLERLAARKKMDSDELLHKNEVYLKQDKSFSQEAKSDINLSQEAYLEKAPANNILTELPDLPEPMQVDKPFSSYEIRQKYAEMLAKEMLKDKRTGESDELLEDIDDTNAIDKSKGLKRDDGRTKPDKGIKGKNGKKAEPVEPKDPLTGVTPANIDIKLKETREKLSKIKNFESVVNEKFMVNIKAADNYLAQGQYHNAIDAYEMACAWKNNDPVAHAGKAYAHLAAGEYLNSLTHLIQALEYSGEFAGKRADIAGLIGNKKLYEKRLSDLKGKYESGRFYKTAFLLAYLSWQDGDFVKAKECIDSAAPKMGKTKAWKSLNKAIEEGLAKQ